MNFVKKDVSELDENFVKLISKDWMLITTPDEEKINAMTASWGGVGEIWAKHASFAFVRPSRHTFKLLEQSERYVLNFLNEGNRDALNYCGKVSGRDADKIAETGLKPVEYEKGVYVFEQSKYAFVCRKMYAQDMKTDCFITSDEGDKAYPNGDIHRMYIGEIEYVLVNE